MASDLLERIDKALVEADERLGQLHAWLDNPTPLDLDSIQRELDALEIPSDQHFLRKKRSSLQKQAGAMTAVHSQRFTQRCIAYFENLVPAEEDVALAEKLLKEEPKAPKDASKKLSASEIAEKIREAVSIRGLGEDVIVLFPYPQAGTVSLQSYLTKPSEIRISPNVEKTQQALEKTIVHEIDGHLIRSLNGRLQFPQSAFYSGTSGGYLLAEEGITNHLESLKGHGLTDRIPAAHIVAIDAMLKGATKPEITSLLIEKGISEKNAESIATKAKRGVNPDQQGGYVGGASYLLGRLRIRKYLEHGGRLETLLIGKISFEDVPVVEEMLATGTLKKPGYTQ